MKKATIEVEFRAIFDEKKFNEIESFLTAHATDLGADDKNVVFYIMPDKLAKVVDNVSKQSAKLVLKSTKIGKGSAFEETEIPFSRDYVAEAVTFMNALDLTSNVMKSFQKRHNFLYKDVEAALKYSDVWGYHLELEVMISDLSEKAGAEKIIQGVADELGVHLMTDAELEKFTKEAEEKYRKETKK